MPDAAAHILSALERDDGGIALVLTPLDLGLRDWVVDEVNSLAHPDANPLRTRDVEEAIATRDRMVLLVPDNEREAVLDLNGSRDRIIDPDRPRAWPIVLFLFRDGEGMRTWAQDAPSLASIVLGSTPDPDEDASIDVSAERRAFEAETGETPEAWLRRWRDGSWPKTSKNFSLAYRANLLETR